MQEIEEFNENLRRERKASTLLVGALLIGGLAATVPLFTDSIKHSEILFCRVNSDCRGSSVRRGIAHIIDNERRNQLFDINIRVLRVLPPEDSTAYLFGIGGSIALLVAYATSKSLTDKQEKAIHSQFALLKIKALENDIIVSNHIDLTQFSKQQQSEITKQAIARQTAETIEAMKSPGEQQLDHLNGTLQGELSMKNHELQLSEMDKQIVDNRLQVAETNKKLSKLSSTPQDEHKASTQSPSDQLKTSLVDALKSHEDGWLWKIIDNQKPVWVLGEAGSGKSTLAASIVMLRQYLFDMPLYQLIDAHAGDNLRHSWKYLKPQFIAQTEDDIAQAFDDARERWLDRINNQPDKTSQQLLVDEFTNYSESDITNEPARKFVKASLSDPRKAEERLVCIAHFFTNTATGGSGGTAKGRARGTIQIDRKTADGKKPLPVATINGLNDSSGEAEVDKKVTIPDWLTPDKILDHFNGKPINFED
jgi:hypothetical protein